MMGGLYMEAVKMKWDEIVEKYPDRWVALSDYEKDGPYILEGVLLAVCREPEMLDAERDLKGRGISHIWRRTTDLEGANAICVM